MNKVVFGLILGGVLGIFDGLTAWFTPEARAELIAIVVGSTIKGIIAGILIGFFARKVHSLALGILFGLGVGTGKILLRDYVAGRAGGVNCWLCHAEIWRLRRRNGESLAPVLIHSESCPWDQNKSQKENLA